MLPRQRAALSGLTRLHAIIRVIASSLINNNNLACGNRASLENCVVMAITGDYGMAIVTQDRLYFVLSCRLTPTDAMSMLYGGCANNGDTCTFPGPHLRREWTLRRFGPMLLVGFWCEDTGHVESPDLSSSRC
jgi:hypothetical protein